MRILFSRAVTTLLVLGCASLLPAQRTWIVDKNGGPGVDFLDLPPAHDAAAPGDIILLRPLGNQPLPYTMPPFITKPLTIRGDDVLPVAVWQSCILENAPAGMPYVFDNIYYESWGMAVRRCAAQVVFTRCWQSGSNIGIEDCANVIFEDCVLYKHPFHAIPIRFNGSTVTIVRCELRGQADGLGGQTLFLERSQVDLVDTLVTGGNVRSWERWYAVADTAIVLLESSLWLRGSTEVHAGQDHGMFGVDAQAIVGAPPSSLVADPTVQYFAAPHVPPNYLRGMFVSTTELTHVAPGPAQRGSTQTVEVVGPRASSVVLLASPLSGHGPIRLSLGNVYLIPEALIPVGTAAVDPARRVSFTVPIATSVPSGLGLAYQALSLSTTGALQIGSHAVSIVE